MEELFNKKVSICIRKADREERQTSIDVCVLLNISNTPVHKKELVIRLTDETDPFFLYSLTIGEEDFQHLKTQQGLLVDFSAFPQKLIDLLELCLSETEKEVPKFQLYLVLTGDKGFSSLKIIETNPFRHLTHLDLRLVPASDTYLKKYLAESLLSLKEHNIILMDNLSRTKSDLTAQLAHAEEALDNRNKELEKLKTDWNVQITTLNNKHSALLNTEKERAMQIQVELQHKLEKCKEELETSYQKKVVSLEKQIKDLDISCKDLTDHKYRSEAAIRELKAKLRGSEEELRTTHEELNRLRKENCSLDSGKHEQDKIVNQLSTRVAVLQQEVRDKEQVIQRTTELLETANENKHTFEIQLEQKHRQTVKLDTAYKQTSQEVIKGNEIIMKLQSDIKGLKSKLKLRNMVTTQQEKLLHEKDIECSKHISEVSSLHDDMKRKDEDIKNINKELKQLQDQLLETKEALKTSENVVTWLNKQVNEQMLSRGSLPRQHTIETPSTIQASRLSNRLITGGVTTTGIYQPRFSSTPSSDGLLDRPVLRSLVNQQDQQKVLFRGAMTKSLQGLKVASPLSVSATPTNLGVPNTEESTKNEPYMDSKYLPSAVTTTEEQLTPGVVKSVAGSHPPLINNYLPK